jgi:coenzyme Q-binding protein COQ10
MLTRILRACAPRARRSWAARSVTNHRQTLDLPYRPEDLFDLASDVGRYPDFIHWIQSLKLLSEQEDENRMRCRAEVTVGFKDFRETFITDVDARSDERAIDVNLVRGPFRKLSNQWRFQPIPTGTRVDFLITFEFRNFVLQALADANKAFAVRRVIDAFVSEAARRYSKVQTPV